MDVRLIIKDGATKGQTIQLRTKETRIGRHKGCEVRIPSALLSRQHCLLRFDGDLLTIEDLLSANGTFLNGQRVSDIQVVRPGDKITIGPVTFVARYQLTPAAVERLNTGEDLVVEPEVIEEGSTPEIPVEIIDDDFIPVAPEDILPPIPLAPEENLENESEDLPTIEKKPLPKAKKTHPKQQSPGKSPPSKDRGNKPSPRKLQEEPTVEQSEDMPDASLIFGKGKKWDMPEKKDLRDLLGGLDG